MLRRRVLRPYGVPLALALSLLLAACGSGDEAPVQSPTPSGAPTPLAVVALVSFETASGGEATLRVEIADTPEERAKGLMGRPSLAADAGMLFAWPEDTGSGFWMKDTLVPLSIAFISAEGEILHIEDMQPLDETMHRSPQPYRYAVEANQGWFAANDVGVGAKVRLPTPP